MNDLIGLFVWKRIICETKWTHRKQRIIRCIVNRKAEDLFAVVVNHKPPYIKMQIGFSRHYYLQRAMVIFANARIYLIYGCVSLSILQHRLYPSHTDNRWKVIHTHSHTHTHSCVINWYIQITKVNNDFEIEIVHVIVRNQYLLLHSFSFQVNRNCFFVVSQL